MDMHLSGKQAIVLTVPRLPSRAGVDPYRKLIERERDDNVVEVTAKSGMVSIAR